MSEESPNTRISPQTQPSLHEQIADAVRTVRETTPLAQSFTNFVTINLVANAQLAAGGAAAMSFLPDDIIDTATISGADYINVGTLLPFYKDALPQVARAFHNTGHPWVLDPVAAGIGETRTAILQSFKRYPPTVIRGNASEIIALDAMWGLNEESATATASKPAGVESVDDVESAIAPAQRLARFMARHGANGTAAVAVSGATDMVTDGEHVYRLAGGSAMMTKIIGAGCSARRRHRRVSRRRAAADRRARRHIAVQHGRRDSRETKQRPRFVPGGAAGRAVERYRRGGGRPRDRHAIAAPPGAPDEWRRHHILPIGIIFFQ